MKNSEFTNQNNEKVCRTCEYGRLSSDKTAVICVKKGVVSPDYNCKLYIYDPLKRDIKAKIGLADYSKEDFDL